MLVDQIVFVVAAFALGSAALRVAARITATVRPGAPDASLVDRLLVAAPVAAAFAVCWTLALGLVGLSGSPAALAAGPVVAWAAARRLLSQPTWSMADELAARWTRTSRTQRAAALALAGAAVGCMLEVALEPAFDTDAIAYHLPDVIGWLHSGHAGAVQTFGYDYPVGYYPITNEVLLSWVLGISRSFAPLAAWSTAAAALALLAMTRLLHLLRVPRAVVVAALAAFVTLPIFLLNLNFGGPGTDLPAVTWLACTAALCAGARERPALLGPALLAAGLGVGTKTTVAPLMAAALLAGAWQARSALRSSRGCLAVGATGGLLVGGPWYLRDTIAHGWPLWPFSSGPTGDPLPHTLTLFHATFLSRPGVSISLLGSGYVHLIAGGLVLIVGVLAIPLLARSRDALLAATVAVASLLLWTVAPFTGVAQIPALENLGLSALRYLLGALGACAVALAIAGRDAGPPRRRLTIAVLTAATAGSIVGDALVGYPGVPKPQYLLAGAAVGAAAGAIGSPRRLRISAAGLRLAAALLAGAALVLSAPGWVWRESQDGSVNHALLAFMLTQPGFAAGSQPIAFAPATVATLAGPRLSHPISLLPAQDPCARVQARLRRGWVVVWPGAFVAGISTAFDAPACLRADAPIASVAGALVYSPMSVR